MKTVTVRTGYNAYSKPITEKIYINNTPIKNEWDLLCAIKRAEIEVEEAIDAVCWHRTDGGKQLKKAVNKIMDNLFNLTEKYQHENTKGANAWK